MDHTLRSEAQVFDSKVLFSSPFIRNSPNAS